MVILETERLLMRPISMDDIEDLYKLNLDPDVIKYTGDPAFRSIEHTRAFYSNYKQYEKYKMGRFSTFLKSDNTFIGWCGLKQLESGDIDLGYRFFKEHWNKGYATESAKESLNYGFINLNIESIIAQAHKENIASIEVMKKIGMNYCKDFTYNGHEAIQYTINKEQFLLL